MSKLASPPRPSRLPRWLVAILSLVWVAGCASAPPPPPPCPADAAPQQVAGGDPMIAWPPGQVAPSEAVPVGADDPQRGNATALVTIVEFAEFQCPFCARVTPTIDRLLEVYGPDQVRVVWKHLPLEFHQHARPAAEMAVGLMKLGGNDAFWRFHREALADGGRLSEEKLGELAQGSGFPARSLADAMGGASAKVDADLELAASLDVRGTPGFLINGIFLSGAQPYEQFAAIVDAELAEAKVALAEGTPRDRLYAARVAANRKNAPLAEPRPDRPRPEAPDTTVWAVPIDGSPVKGKPDALVTIVEFGDFQCPFCARANTTLGEVAKRYGDKVRFVHKARPLPFHKEARPAAQLAFEVLARKGNDAFWRAHDELYTQQRQLDEQALGNLAAQLGLDRAQALAAIKAKKHEARIEKDEALADDLEASGTPHFFINGRRLVGAQPLEEFAEIIDAELIKAEGMVREGTRADRVYETILARAKPAEPQFKTIDLPAPTAKQPSRGPTGAPVVIQVFSDFECPFCARFAPTLDEIAKAYPTEVRIVFRQMPLAMHTNAMPAAEASLEAFAQGGSKTFWKMHDALFAAAAANRGGLDRQGLETVATQVGLDLPRLRRALDGQKHRAAAEADAKLAGDHGISGTPTTVVGRYVVSGAQPIATFKRVIAKVLAERKQVAAPAKR